MALDASAGLRGSVTPPAMSEYSMFEFRADSVRNLAQVRYFGHVTAAGMAACAQQIEAALPSMRPGFTVLSDLSGLEAMDLDCVPHLTRIMDLCRIAKVGAAVRVIPDRDKDIGFNILSIIHLRRGVKIYTCETMAEAERLLPG
jgi:hypothetical protein